jgi:hypothetical protein
MNSSLKDSVANAAVKLRVKTECTPDVVTLQLLLDVSRIYKAKYGYVPASWSEYCDRHKHLLEQAGYTS